MGSLVWGFSRRTMADVVDSHFAIFLHIWRDNYELGLSSVVFVMRKTKSKVDAISYVQRWLGWLMKAERVNHRLRFCFNHSPHFEETHC